MMYRKRPFEGDTSQPPPDSKRQRIGDVGTVQRIGAKRMALNNEEARCRHCLQDLNKSLNKKGWKTWKELKKILLEKPFHDMCAYCSVTLIYGKVDPLHLLRQVTLDIDADDMDEDAERTPDNIIISCRLCRCM